MSVDRRVTVARWHPVWHLLLLQALIIGRVPHIPLRETSLPLGNTSAAKEPETKAIMENLIQKGDFSLSVALDAGSLLVTYPYDKPVQTGMGKQLMESALL